MTKPTFRDPAARDAAWGRYYRRRGLRPVTKNVCPISNPIRLAAYAVRKALSTATVKL